MTKWRLNQLDPTEDWDLFDGATTITYERYVPVDNTYGDASIGIDVLIRSLDGSITNVDQGELMQNQIFVHLPSSQLSPEPARLDRITLPDGTVFIVQNGSTQTLGTRYRLLATKVP